MSRWWPDTVALRLSGGGSPAEAQRLLRVGHALHEFDARIDRAGLARGTRVQVWVGHDIARLLMVPAQGSLASRRDREDFARHCFGQTFGPAAATWRVRVADVRPGRPALACALPDGIESGVTALLARRGLVLAALRPLVMEAFNRDAGRLASAGSSGWLLVGEAHWLTALRLDAGVPGSVQTLARARQPLLQVLEREALLAGLDPRRGTVWHAACAGAPAPAEGDIRALGDAGWSFHALPALQDVVDSLAGDRPSARSPVAQAAA